LREGKGGVGGPVRPQTKINELKIKTLERTIKIKCGGEKDEGTLYFE